MTIFERLGSYFTKNAGLNTVTGAVIPVLVQQVAGADPALAGAISGALNVDVSTALASGGYGAAAAVAIIALRVFLGMLRAAK